jgi:hypothetical protein
MSTASALHEDVIKTPEDLPSLIKEIDNEGESGNIITTMTFVRKPSLVNGGAFFNEFETKKFAFPPSQSDLFPVAEP